VTQFELYRGESAERALRSASVVDPLDPGHYRKAKFGAGGPSPPVEHIALQRAKNDSIAALSPIGRSTGRHRRGPSSHV